MRIPHPARVLLLGLAALLAACGRDQGNGRHLILVTLDTSRADFFGCYGRAGDPTPHFDALAADGVRFALAISAAAVTPVSHASILTGLYPYEHGLRVLLALSGFRVRRDVPTLALVLKDAGYRTAAVHSAFPVSGFFGFDDGFDVFESFDVELQDKGQSVGWDTTASQRRSDETTDLAIDLLDGGDQPLFLWVHYWDPHDPILLPPPELIPDDAPRLPQGFPPSSALYQAELSYVDAQFGRLVAELKRRGMYEDAVIAVVADHGEGLEDGEARHGWAMHRELYQEQLHVPLFLRTPDAPRGRVVEEVVSTVDLYPTLLESLALEPPREVSGVSLAGLIAGRPEPGRLAYADQINLYDFNASMVARRPQSAFVFSLTDGRWKLIYRPTHPGLSELFDLDADPQERDNLFAKARAREPRVRLLRELASRAPWVTEPFGDQGGREGQAAASQALASLGYTAGGDGPTGVRWEWICPEHDAQRAAEPRPCPVCGAPPVPVAHLLAEDE